MNRPPAAPLRETAEAVLTFLESVGRRSEAQLYLNLFSKIPGESFALVVPSTQVLRDGLGALAEQLGFLGRLGLFSPVVLGVFDEHEPLTEPEGDRATSPMGSPMGMSPPADDEDQVALAEHLREVGLHPLVLDVPEGDAESRIGFSEKVAAAVRAEQTPVLLVRKSREVLVELARGLRSRKLVLLRHEGGIGPSGLARIEPTPGHVLGCHDSGISVINLRSDHEPLLASGLLNGSDEILLGQIAELLEGIGPIPGGRVMISVAAPWHLLNELFTVRGAGTLVKRGAVIERHENYRGVDLERVLRLLESSFGRRLHPGFRQREPHRLFLEQEYRGLALLERGEGAAFLSKFAVEPVARGEGLGQDLWWALVRESPSVYWRSRTNNPINPWYETVCDGMQRGRDWNVYWHGVAADKLPALIDDALTRAPDFV